MSNFLIAFILAAGGGAFAYSKLGKRVGYGNTTTVWKMVAISFAVVFVVAFTALSFVVHFHGVSVNPNAK